ncbi:MAG: glycosyltransferase family 4 protein [Chloroflexi bacterium]|nr:glycosyltransferase family 4 protein [Chloroflexota bacterium]
MQRLSRDLVTALGGTRSLRAMTWGGGQAWLPGFLSLAAGLIAARPEFDRIDVIVAGDVALAPVGWALARLSRRPLIVVAHGLDVTAGLPLYPRYAAWGLRRATGIVAISAATAELVARSGVTRDRIAVIPPGITPPERFDRVLARAWLARRAGGPLNDRPVLAMVGRLVPRKGTAWFLRTCLPQLLERFPECLVAVAGDGPESSEITTVARDLPRAILLLGRCATRERDMLFSAADLFIAPMRSIPTDPEGFGLVAMEAAAAALPSVGVAVGGLAEAIVPGITGDLAKAEGPDALVTAIASLLDDRERRRALCETAAAYAAQHHAWAAIARRWSRYIDEVAVTRVAGRDAPDGE